MINETNGTVLRYRFADNQPEHPWPQNSAIEDCERSNIRVLDELLEKHRVFIRGYLENAGQSRFRVTTEAANVLQSGKNKNTNPVIMPSNLKFQMIPVTGMAVKMAKKSIKEHDLSIEDEELDSIIPWRDNMKSILLYYTEE